MSDNLWDSPNLIKVLKEGGVAVMPTDTLYGVVARAEDKIAIDRIYKIKKRNPAKKLITLIADWEEVKKFGIDVSKFKIPESSVPTTFILEETSFRVPQSPELRELLGKTGPLVAPSANLEGEPPAKNIEEARKYFGDAVDLYIDGGEVEGQASKIIRLYNNGELIIIRE